MNTVYRILLGDEQSHPDCAKSPISIHRHQVYCRVPQVAVVRVVGHSEVEGKS